MNKKDLRNCRCCMATYEKPIGLWSEFPLINKETKKPLEPIGFCEFCDKNNKTWYTPNAKCHKQ